MSKIKANKDWHQLLSAEQFHILREKGTEPPFSGKYNKFYEPGTYYCAACGNELFDSKNKFDSGSGWPSFTTVKKAAVIEQTDRSHYMKRMEVICAECESHLGHVFNDGPAPTGLRYCINSVALDFKQKK